MAEVRACENLKESKKLLHSDRLRRPAGALHPVRHRQVWFKPEDLIGKKIGIVCNLAPRPMLKGASMSARA